MRSKGDHEFVGGQQVVARERSDAGFGLPTQQSLDFLWDDRSPEYAGECIADARLEPALEPSGETLRATHALARRPCFVPSGR
jgi:hypothetical protein